MLALPFSFSPLCLQARELGHALTPLADAIQAEHALQGWRDYARAGIVPDFDWADRPVAKAPDLLTLAMGGAARQRFALTDRSLGVTLETSRSLLRDLGRSGGSSAIGAVKLAELAPVGLRQEIFSPGVSTQTRLGRFELGAVFTYQRFASWDFGAFSAADADPGTIDDRHGRTESSFGQGVRVGLSGQIGSQIGYQFDYRSKVDMDAFNTYRGVYSQPGEFDLPAIASARFGYQLGPTTAVSFGVERVYYSDVEPFLSQALPNRFVALLGDGSSPEFVWRDLTVYSAEWRWLVGENDAIALRYSTRQQPEPTSNALRRALAQDFTNHNYAIGYTRKLGSSLQLGFSASYAPASYFLGYPDPFVRSLEGGEQIEAELLLTALF